MVGESLGENIRNLTDILKGIRDDLEDLRNNTNNINTMLEKANDLLKKAKDAESKLKAEIGKIKSTDLVDENIKLAKEKAEELLKIDITKEIQNLLNSIKQKMSEENIITRAKNRIGNKWNRIGNKWNRIGNQWNILVDPDKRGWNKEGGKNLLRGAGFGAVIFSVLSAIGYGASQGVKKIGKKIKDWRKNRGNNESDTEDEKKDKKNTPFGDRWYKILKYSIIGLPICYIAHGLATGRWDVRDLLNLSEKDPDSNSSSEDQVKGAEELKEKDPEKFDKYKNLGDNVDKQFNYFMDKEIQSGWGGMSIADGYEKYVDKTKLSLDDFKAIVPLCIDNQFDSVSKFMSEGGYYDYLRDKKIDEFKSIITKEIGNGSSNFLLSLGKYVFSLRSFKEDFKERDNIGQSILNWLNGGTPTERIDELQLFFRQYVKILNYIQDKRYQLRKSIATQIFELDRDGKYMTAKFSTVDDALDDEEWVSEYVENNDKYKNFMQGKLSNAIDVLKSENLFDENQSTLMKQIKKEKDKERSRILNEKNGEDTLSRLDKNKNNMDDEMYEEGIESARKVYNDIEENFDKDWWYLHCSATYTLFNLDEKNKFEFLRESGLDAMKTNIKKIIIEYQQKFKDKTIKAKEIEEYNKLINGYFAMKKEIYLASEVIQSMKCDETDWLARLSATSYAIIGDFIKISKDSWKNLTGGNIIAGFTGYLEATIPLYAIGSAVSAAGGILDNKILKTGGKRIENVTAFGVMPNISRRTSLTSIMPDRLLKMRYDIPNGDSLLFQDLIEGNISGEQAGRLVTSRNTEWIHTRKKLYNSLAEFVIDIGGITDSTTLSGQDIARLFSIEPEIIEGGTSTKYGISLGKNQKLRKCIFGEPKIPIMQYVKRPINGYRKKKYDLGKVKSNLKALGWDEFFLGDGEGSFNELVGKKKYFVGKILETGDFSGEAEISNFIKMLSDKNNRNLLENIENLSIDEIKKIINELRGNTSNLGNITEILKKINRIKPININPDRLRKSIFTDINKTIADLNDGIKQANNAGNKAQAAHLQQQLDEFNDFKVELGFMSKTEFGKIDSLIKCFSMTRTRKTLNEVISDVKKLKRIMDVDNGKLTIEVTPGVSGRVSIDDILKDIENAADNLRKAKNFHQEIANELEDMAKVFEKIKIKNVNKALGTGDDILRGIKMLVKLARVA